MPADDPVVSVKDIIKVKWPVEDGTTKQLLGTIIEVKSSKKRKYGSCYKYIVRFENEKESFETRLIHLKYKIVTEKQAKKRKHSGEDAGDSLTKPKKNGEVEHIPPMPITDECLKYVVAPMVGASELAFRLLCRRYGATIAYTPMINSEKFAIDETYRSEEFQTVPADRPLVAHFSANNPQTLLAAAKHVEHRCDAIGAIYH